jgi:hypothetical protein
VEELDGTVQQDPRSSSVTSCSVLGTEQQLESGFVWSMVVMLFLLYSSMIVDE